MTNFKGDEDLNPLVDLSETIGGGGEGSPGNADTMRDSNGDIVHHDFNKFETK